jgi:hypothetical protein
VVCAFQNLTDSLGISIEDRYTLDHRETLDTPAGLAEVRVPGVLDGLRVRGDGDALIEHVYI